MLAMGHQVVYISHDDEKKDVVIKQERNLDMIKEEKANPFC